MFEDAPAAKPRFGLGAAAPGVAPGSGAFNNFTVRAGANWGPILVAPPGHQGIEQYQASRQLWMLGGNL